MDRLNSMSDRGILFALRRLTRHPVAFHAAYLVFIAWLTADIVMRMAVRFMRYDDEGYAIHQLRAFFEHGRLYEEVFSQYGPAYFLIYDWIFRFLPWELNHDTGRYLTAGFWIGCVWLCGWFVWRETRSWTGAFFTTIAVFYCLHHMNREPTHPGGLLAVVVCAGFLGARLLADVVRPAWVFAFLGVVTAWTALIKINVGVFFGFACFLFYCAGSGMNRRLMPIALGLSAILPVFVTKDLLMRGNFMVAAMAFCIGGILLLPWKRSIEVSPMFGWKEAGGFCGGFAATALLVILLIGLRGTGPRALLEGMILAPARHPTVFHLPVFWTPGTLIQMGVLMGAGFIWKVLEFTRYPRSHRAIAVVVGFAAFSISGLLQTAPSDLLEIRVFMYLLTVSWAVRVALRDAPGRTGSSDPWTVFLVAVPFWQALQIYPVAGSQLGWGAFLFVPVLVVAVIRTAGRLREEGYIHIGAVTAGLLFLMAAGIGIRSWLPTHYALIQDVREEESLGLPGAGHFRLPLPQWFIYNAMDANLRAYGGTLFSLPGSYSFNLWSGLPTPTLSNVTHWFSLFDEVRQRAIRDVLLADPRSTVIIDTFHLKTLDGMGFDYDSLLTRVLFSEYRPVFEIGGYRFCVRSGRSVFPLHTGVVRIDRDTGRFECRFGTRGALSGGGRVEIILYVNYEFIAVPIDYAIDQLRMNPIASHFEDSDKIYEIVVSGRCPPGDWDGAVVLVRIYDADGLLKTFGYCVPGESRIPIQ